MAPADPTVANTLVPKTGLENTQELCGPCTHFGGGWGGSSENDKTKEQIEEIKI